MDSMDNNKINEEDYDKMRVLKEDEEDEMTKKSKKLLNDFAKKKRRSISENICDVRYSWVL